MENQTYAKMLWCFKIFFRECTLVLLNEIWATLTCPANKFGASHKKEVITVHLQLVFTRLLVVFIYFILKCYRTKSKKR